jgi:hypothetical protein
MTAEQPERRLDPRHSMDGDLTNRFTYHAPEPEQPEVYQLVRDVAHLLALVIESATYPSPERTLATVKAEEAVMWANAGIARRGITDAAYAGARDLFDAALDALYQAKPESPIISADPEHWAADTAMITANERFRLARAALIATGYFTEDQVGADLAPRITELWSYANRALSRDEPEEDMDYADGNGPVTFHEGKTAPDAFMPLVVSLDADDGGLRVRNPEVLNGRGVLVLPPGLGIEWQDVLSAFRPEGATSTDETVGIDVVTAVCPKCPELIRTEGKGAQRDAQDWLTDHLAQAHGSAS